MGRVKDSSESQVAAMKILTDSGMFQKDITLQMGCSQFAVSKILTKEQSDGKNFGRKDYQARWKSAEEDYSPRFSGSNEIC